MVDYAETRRDRLVPLIRGMRDGVATGTSPLVRLVLLARGAFDWWEQLQSEEEAAEVGATAVRTMRMVFLRRPVELAPRMALLASSYLETVREAGVEPDADLLTPIAQAFEILRSAAESRQEGE